MRSRRPVYRQPRRGRQTLGVPGAVAAGVTAGVSAIPVVGQILGPILGLIFGVFGAHSAKVKQEAAVLNAGIPNFIANAKQIFAAANAGQIDVTRAKILIDQAVSDYYVTVQPSLEKSGPCPQWTISSDGNILPDLRTTKDVQQTVHTCNGPCVAGCINIERWAALAKWMLDQSGRGREFWAVPGHAGFKGTPSWGLKFTGQAAGSAVTAGSSSSSAGMSAKSSGLLVMAVIGGALLFLGSR